MNQGSNKVRTKTKLLLHSLLFINNTETLEKPPSLSLALRLTLDQ